MLSSSVCFGGFGLESRQVLLGVGLGGGESLFAFGIFDDLNLLLQLVDGVPQLVVLEHQLRQLPQQPLLLLPASSTVNLALGLMLNRTRLPLDNYIEGLRAILTRVEGLPRGYQFGVVVVGHSG